MYVRALAVAAVVAAAMAGGPAPRAPLHPPGPAPADTAPPIPSSVRDDHLEVMGRLTAATRERGPVGEAARELTAVLMPHFEREERFALPPLGLLAPLAAGQTPAGVDHVLALSDTLQADWPRMMEEHRQIRAAVDQFQAIARAEGRGQEYDPLVEMLRRHARMEEEVLYPAAVLAAEVVRTRRMVFRPH